MKGDYARAQRQLAGTLAVHAVDCTVISLFLICFERRIGNAHKAHKRGKVMEAPFPNIFLSKRQFLFLFIFISSFSLTFSPTLMLTPSDGFLLFPFRRLFAGGRRGLSRDGDQGLPYGAAAQGRVERRLHRRPYDLSLKLIRKDELML
jgi:hypothetical protein